VVALPLNNAHWATLFKTFIMNYKGHIFYISDYLIDSVSAKENRFSKIKQIKETAELNNVSENRAKEIIDFFALKPIKQNIQNKEYLSLINETISEIEDVKNMYLDKKQVLKRLKDIKYKIKHNI